ncbi:MAG: hypothetical protein M3294_05970 [Pseudomonadota bacterium]|nr:hypothetical protein [Pseudomonadota bacterium]
MSFEIVGNNVDGVTTIKLIAFMSGISAVGRQLPTESLDKYFVSVPREPRK